MSQTRHMMDYFKLKKIGVFLLVTSLLLPSTLLDSYGEDSSADLLWQLVYVSGEQSCDNHDKLLMETYSELTSEYLALYELQNTKESIRCFTEQELEALEYSENIDLLILVFDDVIGQKVMETQNLDGFYMHTGNDRSKNHTIVMCHCSNFDSGHERKLPSWILTHELSHFVLSWRGYDFGAVERFVHLIDKKYDQCISIESGECEDRTLLKPAKFTQNYLVFPVIELAVGNDSIKVLKEDTGNFDMVLGFQKEVTRWWLNNMIDDDMYLNATKQLFISPSSAYSGMKLQSGIEFSNHVIIFDHAKEKPDTWETLTHQKEKPMEEKLQDILDFVHYETSDSEKELLSFGDIPQYFKQRADYWVNGKINDEQFVDSMDRLLKMKIIPIG